jgi:hypothetical protein
MKSLHLFAQIAKIDESKHEVWGIATAEVVDKEGEIFDYDTSKPYFKHWSEEISKATDGKSLGNVREMHAPSAVGKLVAIDFDDSLRQIRVGARIIDSAAWQKCLQGVYTGFSIGGAYVKAWKDGDFTRFTANPVEISVVDNPCVPGAHFTAVKADGTFEVRKFQPPHVNNIGARHSFAAKLGAKHSKQTLSHLNAIKACMDQMAQSQQDASSHMDALLGSDDDAAMAAASQMTKIPGDPRPGLKTGEHTMLEANDKAQLEKDGSAIAFAKLAAMEHDVASLRTEMESNNQEIQRSLSNLLALVEKIVAPYESGARVARTGTPTHTVTKEDDAHPSLTKSAEPGIHEMLKQTLQKPQPASAYLR